MACTGADNHLPSRRVSDGGTRPKIPFKFKRRYRDANESAILATGVETPDYHHPAATRPKRTNPSSLASCSSLRA
jgi:hypothetical protein